MFTDLIHRLRSLFRRNQVEKELDEELRFHYEMHVERGIRSGLSRQEAQRQARLAIGTTDSVQEEHRDARGISLIESVGADLRHAARIFARNPVFAGVIVCSLAIGIGANTAIFTLMDAILWRSLPIRNPESLWLIGTRYADGVSYGVTYRDYRLIAEDRSFFSGIAAYGTVPLNVSIDGSIEPTAEGQMVTGGYFPLLDIRAVRGRTLGPEDDRVPSGHPVAMVSHGYWQRRFASDPSIVGRTVLLCGTPFTIVGVTPREFFGIEVGKSPDFFVPAMMQPQLMPASENLLSDSNLRGWLNPFIRLNARLTAGQVESQVDFRFKSARIPDPKEPPPDRWKLVLSPAANGISDLRKQFSQPLAVLMAMVGALLLMACANVANMLLARAVARTPEFAMRRALGAGRGRLIQQLLVESLLLAICGGLLGIILASEATKILLRFISSGRAPILLNLEVDGRMLAFTTVAVVFSGITFGLIPAIRLSKSDSSFQPGKLLVVLQVALCVVMVSTALLFGQSLQKLNGRDEGSVRESLLTMRVEPRGSDQRNIPGAELRLNQLYRTLLDDVRAIPGVRAASLAHFTPTGTIGYRAPLTLDSGQQMTVARLMIYPGYFETMGIPLLAGRDLLPSDLNAESPCAVIVNETFSRQEGAIGQTFQQNSGRRGMVQCQIVGVVKDSRYTNLRGEAPPVIFQPFLQTNTGRGQMVLHARIAESSAAIVPRIREIVQKVDPTMPLFEVRSLADEVDAVLVRERMIAALAGFFGTVALALACVGLYGLFSFVVTRRTREFGIRMALGATVGTVVGIVMREVVLLLCIGLAIGIPAALVTGYIASNQISGLLFGITATDPRSLVFAAAILIGVAGVAGFLPARRASRVEPMVALRNE